MLINRHNRAVYSSQAVRHVAERINELYWESEPPTFGVAEKKIQLLTKGTDLASQKYVSLSGRVRRGATDADLRLSIIELLPAEWPSDNNVKKSISKDHTESSRLIIYHIFR